MTLPDSAPLHTLATQAGIQIHWEDAHQAQHTVDDDVLRHVLQALQLPAQTDTDVNDSLHALRQQQAACPPLVTATLHTPIELPACLGSARHWQLELETGAIVSGTLDANAPRRLTLPPTVAPGYHTLRIGNGSVTLALAPPRCTAINALGVNAPTQAWGLSAQLYSLRGRDQPGAIGDFTTLGALARHTGAAGCDALAISPVHAMFSANPAHYSPYSPSSRLWLNAWYIDPYATFDTNTVNRAITELGLQNQYQAATHNELIDWPTVASARIAVLRRLFQGFIDSATTKLHSEFAQFRQSGRVELENHARFEAIHAQQFAHGHGSWQDWPAGLRRPDSHEVQRLAQALATEVEFHAFLQWLATRGLAGAQQTAKNAGMNIGLIADLAVGADPAGSHAWSQQAEVLTGLSPGAPPDIYAPDGQAWGLTAFSPMAMKARGFSAFISTARAAFQHAGGVRIDHALGLARMWLVPSGADPRDGAFVHYPFTELLRLLALESHRHHAIVLGENLGTVPAGFNDTIHGSGMYGMGVLWFEREHSTDQPAPFCKPGQWSPADIATTSTHDLPTVAGWWTGRDLDWRTRLRLLGSMSEEQARQQRQTEKHLLWQVLRRPSDPLTMPAEAPIEHVIDHLGSTPAPLALLPLEDVIGATEQANLPGTIDTHPNWRRRMPCTVEELCNTGAGRQRLQIFARARHHTKPDAAMVDQHNVPTKPAG